MTLGCRPHQRCLMVLALFGIHVGAASQHRVHRGGASGPGAGHQDRLPVQQRRSRVSACRQEAFDHRRAAIGTGEVERGRTQVVGDVRTRTGTDEQIRYGEVIAVRGPMECRRAISLRRVHVDALLHEPAHGGHVPDLDRLNQPQVIRP